SNGEKEGVPLNEVTFSGYNMNQTGNQTVTATWNELSTTFQILVKEAPVDPEKTLVSISLSGNQKTEFTVGDTFSAEGLVVTAHYSDDSSEAIDLNNVEISGYNMNQEGKQTITVSYQGKTATYEITVKAKDTPVTPDDPVTPDEPRLKKVKRVSKDSVRIPSWARIYIVMYQNCITPPYI
ncbi:MAG: bacterial Ig-like domain-containing protein, partial [Bacilli bacterium]|nr:bacterial Ig-like domain-containing protein [Bacilli bacterium]